MVPPRTGPIAWRPEMKQKNPSTNKGKKYGDDCCRFPRNAEKSESWIRRLAPHREDDNKGSFSVFRLGPQ